MNKTGLITKISIKYVLPTCIWKYFRRISRYFAFFWEFRGISWKYLNFAGPRPREISEALVISYWVQNQPLGKWFLSSNPPPLWNFLGLWPPHPLQISNSLHGGGLWIFSGTTQYILKIVNTEQFSQLNFIRIFVFNCFWACIFVKLVNSVRQILSKNSWK